MDLQNAVNLFNKSVEDRKIIGYWKEGSSIILNTTSPYDGPDYPCPSHFKVTDEGMVYPTNPILSPIVKTKMTRI